MNEKERIKKSYDGRKKTEKNGFYTYFNRANLLILNQREKNLLNLLKKFNANNLEVKKIIDIGCGNGGVLRNFIKYGASPENLYGIDLIDERIKIAKYLSPNLNWDCGDASQLPYEENFFDIVCQFTLFSSILNPIYRKKVANEMIRVLRPGGIIIWYDLHIDNPANLDVKSIKKNEIRGLFEDFSIHLKRITLAPPLARSLKSFPAIISQLLETIPLLCTHYLGIIKEGE